MSNAPVWGLGFYVNPPMLAPIVPGMGVVGHYIDRCIILARKLYLGIDNYNYYMLCIIHDISRLSLM